MTYGSGRSVLLQPRRRSAVVGGLRRGEGLAVKVQAISRAGRRGRFGTARLKGLMRLGAVKPYGPKHRRKKAKRRKRLIIAAGSVRGLA